MVLLKKSINGSYLIKVYFPTYKTLITFRCTRKGFEFDSMNCGEITDNSAIILLKIFNQFNDKMINDNYTISYIIYGIKVR